MTKDKKVELLILYRDLGDYHKALFDLYFTELFLTRDPFLLTK